MSAAMVTNGANQLQAVAHLIGTDQLPIPESVSTKRHIQIVQVVWIRYIWNFVKHSFIYSYLTFSMNVNLFFRRFKKSFPRLQC